ncbi:hypothetical protein NDU88_003979 [Pleurodeles waltl]|uniref:Uncharacterized protein n=1 Tax=Pleurodeles waltl TaxID=8319 RepID=A0AAV7UFV5_PLEWA|nr:hypothetical protein NDU88_003979 [Pleurodeles waltl]
MSANVCWRPLETRAFRWWRSGRNLPARAHPCTRPHSCRRPGTAGPPAGAVKHTEAINLKRPAFALDHIHAGAPAWPVRPPLRQSYRG